MKSKIAIFFLVLTIGFVTANSASAAIVNCGRNLPPDASEQTKKENACTIPKLLQMVANIINFLLSYAWLVATLVIVWAGWEMVNAGGNDEAITAAKTTLTNGIIGFALILMSFVILNFVVSIVTGEETFTMQKLLEAFQLTL